MVVTDGAVHVTLRWAVCERIAAVLIRDAGSCLEWQNPWCLLLIGEISFALHTLGMLEPRTLSPAGFFKIYCHFSLHSVAWSRGKGLKGPSKVEQNSPLRQQDLACVLLQQGFLAPPFCTKICSLP